MNIKTDILYRHYKGGLYRVVDIAIRKDTGRETTEIIYQACDENYHPKGPLYVRTSANFKGMVDDSSCQIVPRFEESGLSSLDDRLKDSQELLDQCQANDPECNIWLDFWED